jgi:uncharacterized HAD superfamily protein
MIIGVDIDGVIAEADKQFRKHMKKMFKRDFPRKKVRSFRYEDNFDFTEYEFKALLRLFSDKNLWLNMSLIKGAKEALKILKKNNKIIIATSRPLHTKQITKKWLKSKGIEYDALHFTLDQKHLLPETLNLDFDYFIEDHPDFSLNLAKAGISVLLFSYPWNQQMKDHPKIKRVADWHQALSIIAGHE